MTESNLQALVIKKVDNPIHWINLNPVDSAVGIHNTYFIHWIMIYPVYCNIKHLNKRGQKMSWIKGPLKQFGLHTRKIDAVLNTTVRKKKKKATRKVAYGPSLLVHS